MKNILNIKNLLLVAGMVTLSGCSDFLEQTSPSESTISQTYSSTESANLAINKLYGVLTDKTYGNYIPIIFGLGTDCELVDGLGANQVGLTTHERGCMNYQMATGWATLNNAWTGIYELVKNCNYAIYGIEGSSLYTSGSDEQKAEMGRHLGEALTLRAMAYLDLTRNWGDVPYYGVEQTMGSNLYQPKTDRDEILDKCIEDLNKAVDLLPWADDVPGYTTEHVTKGYALGLLSQVALTRAGYAIRETAKEGYVNLGVEEGDAVLQQYCDAVYPTQRPAKAEREKYYKIAAEAAAKVINSGKHSLNPSFENQWYLLNQLKLDQTYHENLFEIPTGAGASGELGYTCGKRVNGATTYWGIRGNSSGKMKLTGQLFMSYQNTGNVNTSNPVGNWKSLDKRRDVTFALFQWKEATGFKYYNVTHTEKLFYDDYAAKGPFAFYVGKWRPEWMPENVRQIALNAGEGATWNAGINVVRMRYSQVLLNYAEACYYLGGENSTYGGCSKTALEALEEVHCRAYEAADKAAGKQFIEDIISGAINDGKGINQGQSGFMAALMAENAWEFAGEGVRKYDLIRWGQLGHQIVCAKKTFVDGVKEQPSKGGYPRMMYYRFKTDESRNNLLAIDESTLCYAGQSSYPTYPGEKKATKTDCQEQKSFAHGDNGGSATQLNDYLPGICLGLNIWSDIPEAASTYRGTTLFSTGINPGVKNRYILPIGALTISAANGSFANSYGY